VLKVKFRWLTAGESHGPALVVIIEGLPAGLKLSRKFIQMELARRWLGYGRSDRRRIEKDEVEVLAGLRGGKTIGSPIALLLRNLDFAKWQGLMDPWDVTKTEAVTTPRPGHADLPGSLKYAHEDVRNVLERASARETAVRVAAGAFAKLFLKEFDIEILSQVISIGRVKTGQRLKSAEEQSQVDASLVRCLDTAASKKMIKLIEEAKLKKDTLGGIFELVVWGVPPGLGSYVSWESRLDTRLAAAVISIPSVKGVGFGEGFNSASFWGSQFHDVIYYDEKKGFYRKTNRAGGLEGGVTNGEPIRLKAAVKPIPTLGQPLPTVDIKKREEGSAWRERADICVVPAAGVVAEAMVALVLTQVFLEKFGGDSFSDVQQSYHNYLSRIEWKR
jgi:chorismate synthase